MESEPPFFYSQKLKRERFTIQIGKIGLIRGFSDAPEEEWMARLKFNPKPPTILNH